ncbi:hypothetical protein [Martelella alba]|uniref:hypothetical protein n=1 Tax=Martelella alba TaxID=2590451 RepID=UPI001E32B059|nr:hypothetical protein [Martelella alba]
MKRPSALASVVALALCITGIFGGFLWLYPDETAHAMGIGPYSHLGVIVFCLVLALMILILGWFAESVMAAAGETGGN